MQKCGDKFCSNPEVKDAKACRDKKLKLYPGWHGRCYWQKIGQGCEECGAKVVRSGGCYVCIECGFSPCG